MEKMPFLKSKIMAYGVTATISLVLAVSIFAGMQAFRSQLASTQPLTILGGFLGSNFFVFLLTAVNNFEMEMFGDYFQAKLVPEVLGCLLFAIFASALVHRVCVTVCVILSCVYLYYINKISVSRYGPVVSTSASAVKKKK